MGFSLKDYPPEWPQIRARILGRDGHRCQKCFVKNFSVIERKDDGSFILWQETGSYKEAVQVRNEAEKKTRRRHIAVKLAIAHLDNPDPMDVREENLSSRCSYCHFKLDSYLHNVRQRQTWKVKRGEVEGEEPEKNATDEDKCEENEGPYESFYRR